MTYPFFLALVLATLVVVHPCNGQLSIQATSIRSTSIFITWEFLNPTSQYRYRVFVSTNSSNQCGSDELSLSSSLNITEAEGSLLQPRVAYSINVCAYLVNVTGEFLRTQESVTLSTGPAAPTSVDVFINQATQLSVQWNDDDNTKNNPVLNYRVDYWVQIADIQETTSTSRQVTINGLQSNTQYNIRVQSLTNSSNIKSDYSQITSGITVPEKANAPTLLSSTSSSIEVRWDPVSEGLVARSYIVIWSVSNSGSTTRRVVTGTSTTVASLLSNTAYDFTITARNNGGDGQTSDQATFHTVPAKPNAPTRVSSTSTSIEVRWDPVNEGSLAISYIVIWKVSNSGATNSETTTETSTTISSLQSNTAYDFTITARNVGGGNGQPSDQVTFNTVPAKANVPTRLSSTSSSIELEWNPVIEGSVARSYVVMWKVSNSGPTFNRTIAETPTTITNLQSNTAYDFTITARNDAGDGQTSDQATFSTVPAKANVPTRLSSTSSSIELEWNHVNEGSVARSYIVRWRVSNNGPTFNRTIAETRTTITNLQSNTAYDFTITARNDAGDGQPSDQVTFNTVPAKANVPTRLSSTSSSIELRWDPVNEGPVARSYVVMWEVSNNGPMSRLTISETSTTIPSLQSNTAYVFTITARNVAGDGQPSDNVTFNTAPSLPQNVALVLLESDPTGSVIVSWTKPDGGDAIDNYTVRWMTEDSSEAGDESVLHESEKTSFNQLITNLTSGETYDVIVQVTNDVGSTNSTLQTIVTKPAQVRNLTIVQNATDPSRVITVGWNSVDGKGDFINLILSGEPSGRNETTSVLFSDRSVDLSVTPGNNWTVLVTVHSSGQTSVGVEGRISSKPDTPNFSATPSSDAIELFWTPLDGNVGFISAGVNGGNQVLETDSLTPNDTSYRFSNLTSFTSYSVQMYAVITNVLGMEERSDVTSRDVMTLPGVPVVADVAAVVYEQISSTRVTLVISRSTFSERNGPIENYAVYIEAARFVSGTASPNVTQNVSCDVAALLQQNECVALWTDRDGMPSGLGRNAPRNSTANTTIQFVVGASQVSFSPWDQAFFDYPLDLQTTYRVAIAAKTANNRMSATNWQAIYLGGVPSIDLSWLAVLLPTLIGIVALMVGGYYGIRRRKKDSVPQSRSLAPTQTRFNVGSSGFSNLAASDLNLRIPDRKIALNEFALQFDLLQKNSSHNLATEYEELSSVGREQSTENAMMPENKGKNRYTNILPYDATRVILSSEGENSDYINANYIAGNANDKEYIATQGPLPGTRDDFWRLIWEQNCHYIVMLTQPVERGRVKCDQYWPYDSELITVGALSLQMQEEFISSRWTVREFMLGEGSDWRPVTQYNYTSWPDHGVPDTTVDLVMFVQEIRQKVDAETNVGPILVHCSAGVGRSGTFIAMDRLLQGFNERTYVDIFGLVGEMRRNRQFMVQTESQYEFIHQMVADIVEGKIEIQSFPIYETVRYGNPESDAAANETV